MNRYSALFASGILVPSVEVCSSELASLCSSLRRQANRPSGAMLVVMAASGCRFSWRQRHMVIVMKHQLRHHCGDLQGDRKFSIIEPNRLRALAAKSAACRRHGEWNWPLRSIGICRTYEKARCCADTMMEQELNALPPYAPFTATYKESRRRLCIAKPGLAGRQ